MKQVIKKDHVRVGESAEAAAENGTNGSSRAPAARSPHAHGSRGPGAHLVRIDGRVQAIELTCRCGDVSVLEIDYEDPTQPTEATS
jgi:hypothetical protein